MFLKKKIVNCKNQKKPSNQTNNDNQKKLYILTFDMNPVWV